MREELGRGKKMTKIYCTKIQYISKINVKFFNLKNKEVVRGHSKDSFLGF